MPDLKLRLIVNVEYDLNGVAPEDMERRLQWVIEDAFAEGKITGDTEATCQQWYRIEDATNE